MHRQLLVVPLLVAVALSCGGDRKLLLDRDRGLTDRPILPGVAREPLRGQLIEAMVHLRKGDLDAATKKLHAHLKTKPDSALAHYHLGLIHMDEDRFEPARHHLSQARKLDPMLFGASGNLGVLYLRNGEEIAALRALLQAARVAPEDGRVNTNLGNVMARRGRWAEAVKHYATALKATPGHATMMYNLALAHHLRHRHKKALALLEEALMYRPGFALGRALRVACLQSLGRLPEALAAARSDLEKIRPMAESHVVLGRALLASKDVPAALESLYTAIELEPDNAVAVLALGEVLDATGKKPEAAVMYRRFLKIRSRRFEDGVRIRRRLRQIAGS